MTHQEELRRRHVRARATAHRRRAQVHGRSHEPQEVLLERFSGSSSEPGLPIEAEAGLEPETFDPGPEPGPEHEPEPEPLQSVDGRASPACPRGVGSAGGNGRAAADGSPWTAAAAKQQAERAAAERVQAERAAAEAVARAGAVVAAAEAAVSRAEVERAADEQARREQTVDAVLRAMRLAERQQVAQVCTKETAPT